MNGKSLALVGICCWILLATGCGRSPQAAAQQETGGDEQKSSVLVDSEWLDQHRNDPNVRIIDVRRSQQLFDEGHIPGARFVHWVKDITDLRNPAKYSVPPPEQVATVLSQIGVSNDSTIVLTDDFNSRLSTRMFWTLQLYGHEKLKLLDGGNQAWKKSGRKLVSDAPEIRETKYGIKETDGAMLADLKYVQSRMDDDKTVLIDGRPTPQFTGEEPGKVFHTGVEHQRRGHITGAKNIVWKQNFNDDGTFKSIEELRKLYAAHGASPDASIITYCNEGMHAAPPWFVLTQLLGCDDVRLYDNSMGEWANRDDTPMEDGK